MANPRQTTERIEVLRALTDRLLSPDLTLSEAKGLRDRVLALTGSDPEAASYTIPCDCRRNDPQSPGCRHFAA